VTNSCFEQFTFGEPSIFAVSAYASATYGANDEHKCKSVGHPPFIFEIAGRISSAVQKRRWGM